MALDQINVSYSTMLSNYLTISSAALTELRVGSSRLTNRKWLIIQNKSNVRIFIVGQSSIGTDFTSMSEAAKSGIRLGGAGILALPVTDNVPVYALASTGAGKRVSVQELA